MIGIQCRDCVNYLTALSCKAFPERGGIPQEFVTGVVKHDRVHPAQTGKFVFEAEADIEKSIRGSEKPGHKWLKRTPLPGGGFKYVYTAPELLREANKEPALAITGWHTQGVAGGTGFGIGLPGQRGPGTYVALDKPFYPKAGLLLSAIVNIHPTEVLDPGGILDGTNAAKSNRDLDAVFSKINKMSEKQLTELAGDGISRGQLAKQILLKRMGYKAEVGWIEDSRSEHGRELVVWDKDSVILNKEPAHVADGQRFYHGTASPNLTKFSAGLVYLAANSKEAATFAKDSTVLMVKGYAGTVKDISGVVDAAVADGDDVDVVIETAAQDARADGYGYVTFTHPGADGNDFQATVAMWPERLTIHKEPAQAVTPAAAVAAQTPEAQPKQDMKPVDFSNSPEWHGVAYRDAPPEVIARLKQWLADNPEAMVRMYHGTSSKHDILKQGLLPTTRGEERRHSLQSGAGYVYLSIYPDMAKRFGEMAYPKYGTNDKPDVTVYAVDLPVRMLLPDVDQLRNQRLFAERKVGDSLAESIAFGHGARVKGSVMPWALSKLGTTRTS